MNIFQGIFKNWLFVAIIFSILALQIVLVSFGSIAFGVYMFYGLSIQQWMISVAFGSGGLLVNMLLKCINEDRLCRSADPAKEEAETPQGPRLDSSSSSLAINMKRRKSSYLRNMSKNHCD